jgi:two-component system chemotaxis response regulator CheY
MAIPELHFLVVDDLKPVRRIVIALLELLGHTSTFEAEDGCQALAILRARSTCSAPINFVITDWNMPGMDGLDLVAAMRASEGLRDMPVLMISSEIGEQNLAIFSKKNIAHQSRKRPFTFIALLGFNLNCVRVDKALV